MCVNINECVCYIVYARVTYVCHQGNETAKYENKMS